jgi:hypothetical protein
LPIIANHWYWYWCCAQVQVLSGPQAGVVLAEAGVTADTLPGLLKSLKALAIDEDKGVADSSGDAGQGQGQGRGRGMAQGHTVQTLHHLYVVAGYLFAHPDDYRAIITRSAVHVPVVGDQQRVVDTAKAWSHQLGMPCHCRARHCPIPITPMSAELVCMSPAVSFREVAAAARSVVLLSGTLSPLDSFGAELGTAFPHRLEAEHVVPARQIWAGALGVGPGNAAINASYQRADGWGFLDNVGRLVLRCCQTVPHGVLVFVASYAVLDRLVQRWKSTGLWAQIRQACVACVHAVHGGYGTRAACRDQCIHAMAQCKKAVVEPRGADKAVFEKAMDSYYKAIRASEKPGAHAYVTGWGWGWAGAGAGWGLGRGRGRG